MPCCYWWPPAHISGMSSKADMKYWYNLLRSTELLFDLENLEPTATPEAVHTRSASMLQLSKPAKRMVLPNAYYEKLLKSNWPESLGDWHSGPSVFPLAPILVSVVEKPVYITHLIFWFDLHPNHGQFQLQRKSSTWSIPRVTSEKKQASPTSKCGPATGDAPVLSMNRLSGRVQFTHEATHSSFLWSSFSEEFKLFTLLSRPQSLRKRSAVWLWGLVEIEILGHFDIPCFATSDCASCPIPQCSPYYSSMLHEYSSG